MELLEGQDVGAYRVVRSLGRGGMGSVYEVEHRELGVRYALKIFTLDHGDRDLLRRKFLAEGRLLARLRHPRLVRVYDLACDERTGCPYFTMDLVVGPEGRPCTLEDVRRSGGVSEQDVSGWYTDLSVGLRALHAAGVVHRDIKLENVLLDADGRAVLADLGISRILADSTVDVTSVRTSVREGSLLMGTAQFVAPEVRLGGAATPAADYYALGVVLFRLLTDVWYEPGTAVFDLLAPFDPKWTDLIAALTAIDPVQRRLPELPSSAESAASAARRPSRTRMFGLVAALAALAVALGAFFCHRWSGDAGYVVPPDDCFSIPDFIK